MGDKGRKDKEKSKNQKTKKKTKENSCISAESLRVNTKDSQKSTKK